MITRLVPARRPVAIRPPVPELQNGDRLTQTEFHRRYEQMPPGVKAELIGGVVHMPSPTRLPHGKYSRRLSTILGTYEAATPGVDGADNVTIILGAETEPQPDLCLRIEAEHGGRSSVGANEYLVGPPELIIEVAHSSESIDLHAKHADYKIAGVWEYLVLLVREGRLRAFDLPAGRERPVGREGIYKSKVFPGLWIDVASVLAGDKAKALDVLRHGLATPAHGAFVRKLARTARRS